MNIKQHQITTTGFLPQHWFLPVSTCFLAKFLMYSKFRVLVALKHKQTVILPEHKQDGRLISVGPDRQTSNVCV